MEEAIESNLYNFYECNKDLKIETLIDDTKVKLDAEMDEAAALDLEEKEYSAMKQELKDTAQRKHRERK